MSLSGRFAPRSAGIALVFAIAPIAAHGQETPQAPAPTFETTVEAGEAGSEEPRRRIAKNEFDWPGTTFHYGLGFLLEYDAYSQDEESKEQFSLNPNAGVRDARLLFRGRFKTQRPLTWSIGYMYDHSNRSWHFRQTGLMIGFPELRGNLFIGRTKEGYSMTKVMTGYHIPTMERSPALDAFVPILADGIKWLGYFPSTGVFMNLGVYTDSLEESATYATYDHQQVARIGWLPIRDEEGGRLLHVAAMARNGEPDNSQLRQRARPEANFAPYFVDTGSIPAKHALTTGVESYYRNGPWLFGAEYNFHDIDALDGQHPRFQGGNLIAAWIVTGETRPYNAAGGGYFTDFSPKRPVFEGGPGAWEVVLNLSYLDLDDGTFQGGKVWRVTPMVNWHLVDYLKLQMAYGYSVLDRFGLEGGTQFFQARLVTYF